MFETLLRLPRHHYFPIFQWSREKLSWKMSVLVTSEIFRLFVNTLTPYDKYSRRNLQIFWQQLQTLLSQKGKIIFWIFYCISEMCIKLRTFWKNRRVSWPNYYRYYCIRKRCLLKRLKGRPSAHHSAINVLNHTIWEMIQNYKDPVPSNIRSANSLAIFKEKIKSWTTVNVLADFVKRTLAMWVSFKSVLKK